MNVPIRLHYRISTHGGMLYVRESLRGEIVGRFPSSKSTYIADAAQDVVAACVSVFDGSVETIKHDFDVVHVTCKIERSLPFG